MFRTQRSSRACLVGNGTLSEVRDIDIGSDKHLAYDKKQIVRSTTRLFTMMNPSLKLRHVRAFVKEVFASSLFDANEYHNMYHTFEVVQMVTYVVHNTPLRDELSSVEKTMLQVAALCHDFGHNGRRNDQWDDASIEGQRSRIDSIIHGDDISTVSSEKTWSSTISSIRRTLSSSGDEISDDMSWYSTSKHSNKEKLIWTPPHSPSTKPASNSPSLGHARTPAYVSIDLVSDMHNSFTVTKSYNEIMHFDLSIDVVFRHKKGLMKSAPTFMIMRMLFDMIMSTDLKLHDTYMRRSFRSGASIDKMILVLKLADVSHSLRPFHVHLYWVYSLARETNRLTHTRSVDPKMITVGYMAKDTMGFSKRFVEPTLDELRALYPDHLDDLQSRFDTNMDLWSSYVL